MNFKIILICAFLGCSFLSYGQEKYESKFLKIADSRIHYLDFGGRGLPVILIHSEARDAYTFKDFGTKLNRSNRVIAITRPGYGKSDPIAYDVPSQAKAIIDFIKALGIKRAIFCGNASTTAELTFLGENFEREVAGLIFLNGLSTPWLNIHSQDPHRSNELWRRASPGNNDKRIITDARKSYEPGYRTNQAVSIQIPTLAFVNSYGIQGSEAGIPALLLVGSTLMDDVRNKMTESPVKDYLNKLALSKEFRIKEIEGIADDEARTFFIELNDNLVLQNEIYQHHQDVVLPAINSEQKMFIEAFGDHLKLVRLEVNLVVGYEYRDSPELIQGHILEFLKSFN